MDLDFRCELCGSTAGKRIPFRYLFKERYLWAIRCNKCKLTVILPQPSADEITEMYAVDYFTVADKQTHHGETDYITATTNVDYTDAVHFFKKYSDGGNFLEIGCATGGLLVALRNNGFDVTGVEISSFAAEKGVKDHGLNIINKPFTNELVGKELPENHFDIVYMGDVLEHFTNPVEQLRNINKILKKGGCVIAEVPSTLNLISSRIAFFIYRLTGKQKTMTIPPYHLTEFFPDTIKRVFKGTGYDEVIIKQMVKHPSTIPLRHSWAENVAKLVLQYPNYYINKFFGVLGDRLTVIARK